ncbi:hypothetical protein [Bacteroides sp.]|uniref:hypothetical protein n=1 Tax=Bacteroides sp. TaxID=29523 RepID=UPI00262A31C2|nr:hypothetical protein [Bacteroides sp.]
MNKRFLIPALALPLLALSLAGCTDDDMPGNKPLPEGVEFNFGAGVDSESGETRTYYDPTDEANPAATAWKIFWNYEDPKDHIYIYSPEAAAGRNQASYTVNATQNLAGPAPVTKDGDTGVQVGTADSYNFYAMYPASAVTAGSGTGNALSATMPVNQTASATETMTDKPVTELQTTADMNCALMIAKETGYTPTTGNEGKVQLQFEPFATMMDITVNGTNSNTTSNVRITSVIIEADAPIAGDFTYDYSNGNFTFGTNASNSISVETMFNDASGNKVGVLMGNSSTFRVRAFMIPNPDVTTLKVKVVTSQAKNITKTLEMGKFQPKQIHFVKLPKIDVDNLKLDYTIWLSQLDENIYLSEISLPGSALTFNYLHSDDYMQTQTKTLAEQFNAGARVFQCHVNTINQTSSIDGGSTSVGITDSQGNSVSNPAGGYWTLSDVLKALHTEMSGIHKDEFCVLTISDWIADVNESKMSTLYSCLKVILDNAASQGLVATGITPNTTIGDVKGKIIIKVQLNGKYTGAWNQLAEANIWTNSYAKAAETAPYYAPMLYGTLPATNAGGSSASALTGNMNIIYSDCANPMEWKNLNSGWGVTMGFGYRSGVESNATAILAAYADNYNSNEHKNFAMTYLGGCGALHKSIKNTYYYTSQVAATLNTLWLNKTDKPTNKPWGWVMFNCVGDATNVPTTAQGIQAVIEHNADPNFTLARRPAAKKAPSGDVLGTGNGESLW